MQAVLEIALLEAALMGKAADPAHGVCGACYPGDLAPAGAVAFCGYRFASPEAIQNFYGGYPKCATCLAVSDRPGWPCGH